jgi:peptide/nickel transport system substrate-binding protein
MSITRRCLPLVLLATASATWGQFGSELRFCLRSDPKTFDPLLVRDSDSATVSYLTGGVLIRLNRVTQQAQPELATSWKIDQQGRRITFRVRRGVLFSDGTPFSAEDVAYTMNRLLDPKTHLSGGDPFRTSSDPARIVTSSADTVSITFGAPVSGLEHLFDGIPMLSAHSPKKLAAVLGPFEVAEYKPGVEVLLARNPNYWKTDAGGKRLPYVDSIHLQIQQNRDMELVRFRRGELDLISSLDPDAFDQLGRDLPAAVSDAGASLESEMLWFNQAPAAPVPDYKKAWFASQPFRRAVSEAINRQDLARVVFKGHAQPAAGPVSPANRFWFNSALRPHPFDVASANRRLDQAGFRRRDGQLYDREGHPVEFSIMTNAGNRPRERMATMIQQDLTALGIKVNVVTLDFPSLIERMTQNLQYEACLLGLTNVDLDPSGQMNVWLSSSANHQWNPSQKVPATPWEAEIDTLMERQAAETKPEARKRLFDRVQQIAWEQEPFVYLINKNSLMAFSPQLQNTAPAAVSPQAYWNVEFLRRSSQVARSR